MSLLWPAYLLGLLALALPWWLHRFSAEPPQQRTFPSGRFLEVIEAPPSRRRRVRYRLLLALRSAFLLALCLLFAEPVWQRVSSLNEQAGEHWLLIDQSASMRTGSRFEEARAAAREILSQSSAQSFRVIGSDQLRGPWPQGGDTRAGARAAIATLEAGRARLDYGAALQWLDDRAARVEVPVRLSIFSDAQASALPQQRRDLGVDRIAELDIHVVSNPDNDVNAWLTGEVGSSDGVHLGLSAEVSLSASGADPGPISRTLVLRQGDQELWRGALTLNVSEPQSVQVDDLILPPRAEQRPFSLALLEADALADDHSLSLPLKRRTPVPVLLSAWDRAVPAHAGTFVTAALESEGLAEVRHVPSAQLGAAADSRHAIVFADFSEQPFRRGRLPELLQRWQDAGGNLLMVHAPLQRFSSDIETPSVGPGARATVLQSHHPVIQASGFSDAEAWSLPDLNVAAEDAVLVAAGRTPWLFESEADSDGSGHVLWLADPLDGVASNLPLQPVFVDLIHRTLAWFAAANDWPERLYVGETLMVPAGYQLIDAQDDALLGLAGMNTRRGVVLNTPGIHTLFDRHAEHPISVQIDPLESDLSPLDDDALASWRELSVSNLVETSSTDGTRPTTESTRSSAWTVGLWLLAALLLGESILANRHLMVRRSGEGA